MVAIPAITLSRLSRLLHFPLWMWPPPLQLLPPRHLGWCLPTAMSAAAVPPVADVAALPSVPTPSQRAHLSDVVFGAYPRTRRAAWQTYADVVDAAVDFNHSLVAPVLAPARSRKGRGGGAETQKEGRGKIDSAQRLLCWRRPSRLVQGTGKHGENPCGPVAHPPEWLHMARGKAEVSRKSTSSGPSTPSSTTFPQSRQTTPPSVPQPTTEMQCEKKVAFVVSV